jgi:hypothetical protein
MASRIRLGALSLGVALWAAAGHAATKTPAVVSPGVSFSAPDGWVARKGAFRNALQWVKTSADKQRPATLANLIVTTEARRSHVEAVERLREIAAESKARARFVVIGGWPALVRREAIVLPETAGDEGAPTGAGARGADRGDKNKVEKTHALAAVPAIGVTVAVAAGATLVRLEGTVFSASDRATADELQRAAESLATKAKADAKEVGSELELLRRAPPPAGGGTGPGQAPATPGKDGGRAGGPKGGGKGGGPAGVTAAVQVQFGVGELEVAASNAGQDVVVAANSGWSHSHDGGATFLAGGSTPGAFPRDGDPSLGVGQSGAFYYAFIGYPDGTAAAGGVTGCADSVARSTDGGNTFPFLAHAVLCPFTGAGICFPDQEHLASDRTNAAAGGDQVYVVWRQFTATGAPANCRAITTGFVTPSIVCSQNGGTTWTAPAAIGAGDRPRVSVGLDGFVYVTYRSGTSVMLNKFSSCSAGLAQQVGFPVTVAAAVTEVACPMAGLDRCNSFSSQTVSPDDLDANHLYVAYGINTAATNDNVLVRQSTDSGATWSAPVTVNAATGARRFMPWSCAVGGTTQVGWYDRRAATAAAVDLTDYFRGSALVKTGVMQSGTEANVTGASDPQCATGWPGGVDQSGDSELCNAQPQLGGRCLTALGTGSNAACDFTSGPACPAGESCVPTRGAPKYGDYNGIACGFGRVYTAWSSATPPLGTVGAGAGLRVFSSVSPVPSDFYLRDWTASATSHDTGTEPSTNPVFFENSDVWIQTSSAPTAFVGDQPPLDEVAQESTGANGDNYLFVRASRRTPAAPTVPDVSLQVRYYWGDYGMGGNFSLLGSPPDLVMHAADATVIQPAGYLWHVDPTTSTHVCIAAEIDGPGDAAATPHLSGLVIGGATDALVRLDNNKAQRNLGVVVTTGATQTGAAYYAIIHNGQLETRDIVVEYATSKTIAKQLRRPRVEVIGGERDVPVGERGRVVLAGMQPGENRWLGLVHDGALGKAKTEPVVHFFEPGEDGPTTGFSIRSRVVAKETLAFLDATAQRRAFTRMAAAFALPRAAKVAEIAEALLKTAAVDRNGGAGRLGGPAYLAAVRQSAPLMRELVASLAAARGAKDEFGVGAALDLLAKSAKGNDVAKVADAHGAALERLDAWQTKLQKAEGDVADVLQTVRWQEALFAQDGTRDGRTVAEASAEFVRAFQTKVLGARDYGAFMSRVLGPLSAALAARKAPVEPLLAALRGALPGPPPRLQKAHRDLLLKVAEPR